MRERYDVAIIGAGLVGLATARAILQRRPGLRIIVLEKEPEVAMHQSGHNSGVIHSGLYYPPGSLKAQLCRAGREALLRFADEHGIRYRLSGKLVVVLDAGELGRLETLRQRGEANGLKGLRELRAGEIRELEPHVEGIRGLYVPETGVIDFSEVARAYDADVEEQGGTIALGKNVVSLRRQHGGRVLHTNTEEEVLAAKVVSCAGLQSDRVADLVETPRPPQYRIVPFRGDYFVLSHRASELVKGLVYPVPDPTFPFLGVHFTRRIDGEVWAGPNAVPALAREKYGRFHVNPKDTYDLLRFPGSWRLGRRYYRTGVAEIARDISKRLAVREMRRYIRELEPRDIHFGACGVRAQVVSRNGTLVDDFLLDHNEDVLSVVNAPSPAATASLAIGARIAEIIEP
jgi:(S)-2-hydroxyglutarate dehydrogenase